jgi:hypothetical protein
VFSTPMEFIAHHEKVPKAKTKRYPIKTVWRLEASWRGLFSGAGNMGTMQE